MSSRFLCECGKRVDKNLFSGNRVTFLVAEEELDRDFSGVSAEELASNLIDASPTVVRCGSCARLYVIDRGEENTLRAFVPEEPSAGASKA